MGKKGGQIGPSRAGLRPAVAGQILKFRHPKELCSLGVLLRIVSGEGWGRRRFQEEEGAGEEMGPETPSPPFCLPEGGGRLPRAPTYGYASTGKGRPPPGEPPGEREASPREAPS